MLRIAGQMAGPIGLNFFLDTRGWPGGKAKKSKKNFLDGFFHGQRRAFS